FPAGALVLAQRRPMFPMRPLTKGPANQHHRESLLESGCSRSERATEPRISELSTWPKITLVTPALNSAHYIERTIDSVLRQGYPNLEYFVMDGGSTDGTLDIVKNYRASIAAC